MRKENNSSQDKEKESGFQRVLNRARQFYRTYTTGLKSGDIRRLFTKETRGIYEHFGPTEKKAQKAGRIKTAFRTFGQIFWGFLLSMSPARRLLYGLAFFLFIFSSLLILTLPRDSGLREDVSILPIYCFIITSFLLALELADKLSARDEIEIAREIQLSLLPPDDPELPGLQVASFSAPATDVGGDYYDFSSSGQEVYIAIGDVSGHGLASGLLMAMAKSAWQAQLLNDKSPAAVLNTVNKIVRNAGSKRTMMTFLHCMIDITRGKMTYANAGHIYPLFQRHSDGELLWLESSQSYPLGVRESQQYKCYELQLSPGDILYFISDGVVESTNDQGESFGYKRFVQAVSRQKSDDPRIILDGILDDLQDFVKQTPREDDLTIVAVRYQPS